MRQTGKRGRKATSLPVRFVHAGKLCKGEKMVELQGYIDRIVFRNERLLGTLYEGGKQGGVSCWRFS